MTAFHIGSTARPSGAFAAAVDSGLVRTWRELIDEAVEDVEIRRHLRRLVAEHAESHRPQHRVTRTTGPPRLER